MNPASSSLAAGFVFPVKTTCHGHGGVHQRARILMTPSAVRIVAPRRGVQVIVQLRFSVCGRL